MSQAYTYQPLTDAELDQLEAFIFSAAVSEDSLDLIGIHALLCALNISPQDTPTQEWLALIFDGEPDWSSDAEAKQIKALLVRWKDALRADLENDHPLELPCELTFADDPQEPALEIWAQGFMEGVFLHEDAWFAEGSAEETTIAELMLPIMMASSLFEDKELSQIRANPALAEQMAEEIPENLTDLYLLFHAPAD